MQELFKYKGFSIFSYCTHADNDRYNMNLVITDVKNEKEPGKPIQLEREFMNVGEALRDGNKEGKRLIDEIIRKRPLNKSEIDTDLNYKGMKKNIK